MLTPPNLSTDLFAAFTYNIITPPSHTTSLHRLFRYVAELRRLFNKYAREHLPPAVAKKGLYIERIGEGEVPLPSKSAGSKKAKNTAAAKTAVKKTKKVKGGKGGNGGDGAGPD
jgi:hypothetical protein